MQDPFVYIVIVNYQQWQDTCDCLASLLCSTYTNYKIIVVDNNSQNDSFKQMVDWAGPGTPILFMRSDANQGFASGNNVAIKSLGELDAYIWLLNPDMIASENTLEELVNFARQEKKQTIIGATIRSASGNQKVLFYGGARVNYMFARVKPMKRIDGVEKLDYVSGTSLFTHASNFKEYGLLPENYFLYWEETDWCHRARKMGARLRVCITAVCYDKGSTTIGKGYLAHYYYCRNGLLFISKYKKGNLIFALVSMGFRLLRRVVSGQWPIAKGVYRGTMDFLKKRFHAIQ